MPLYYVSESDDVETWKIKYCKVTVTGMSKNTTNGHNFWNICII